MAAWTDKMPRLVAKRNTKENEMTYKFKKGDKLEVVEGTCDGYLTLGAIVYAVEDEDGDGHCATVPISLEKGGENIGGITAGAGWFASRFKLAEEAIAAPAAIDWTKPLETLGGVEFTLVSTSIRGGQPVCGYVGKSVMLTHFNMDGGYLKNASMHSLNLRNVPPKPVETYVYVNAYDDSVDGALYFSCSYLTRELADEGAHSSRVSRIKILLVEGQYD